MPHRPKHDTDIRSDSVENRLAEQVVPAGDVSTAVENAADDNGPRVRSP